MTSSEERVTGYFHSYEFGYQIWRGTIVYVTTERIIANKGQGEFDWRLHLPVAIVLGVAPAVPIEYLPLTILAVATLVSAAFVNRRRFRAKWRSLGCVESGSRRFELRRDHVNRIEVRMPKRRFGYGRVIITNNFGEETRLRVYGKGFQIVNRLLSGFLPGRVKLI